MLWRHWGNINSNLWYVRAEKNHSMYKGPRQDMLWRHWGILIVIHAVHTSAPLYLLKTICAQHMLFDHFHRKLSPITDVNIACRTCRRGQTRGSQEEINDVGMTLSGLVAFYDTLGCSNVSLIAKAWKHQIGLKCISVAVSALAYLLLYLVG